MKNSKAFSLDSLILSQQNVLAQTMWIVGFAFLTAIGSWFEIPSKPVPFTLQTFFVLLSGAVLGARNGAISQVLYLLMGISGLPVFAGFSFGFAKLIGPTGGYLLSFPLAAFITGYLIQIHKSYLWSLISILIGMLIIFSFGTLFLNFVFFNDLYKSFIAGFLIFSWWDGIKIFAVASIYYSLVKKGVNDRKI